MGGAAESVIFMTNGLSPEIGGNISGGPKVSPGCGQPPPDTAWAAPVVGLALRRSRQIDIPGAVQRQRVRGAEVAAAHEARIEQLVPGGTQLGDEARGIRGGEFGDHGVRSDREIG
jgi:hypothetical protein